jgi:biopolymer transport protein ExbD
VNLTKHTEEAKLELQIAPLIDVVFLLLIYFMVTAQLIKKEGDISFMLPAPSTTTSVIDIPMEVLIEIARDGTVVVEGMRFSRDDRLLNELVVQLAGTKAIAESQGARFFVNIAPNAETRHTRVIEVMDACAAAKVESLSFSKAEL